MRVTLQQMCLKPMGGKEPQYIKSKGKRETLNTQLSFKQHGYQGPSAQRASVLLLLK